MEKPVSLLSVMLICLVVIAGCVGASRDIQAAEPAAEEPERMAPRETTLNKINEPIVIDGKLDEEAWQKAERLPIDVIHGRGETLESPIGYGRMMWDDENIYIAFEVFDKDVRAAGTERDKGNIVPPNDVVEIFLDVNNDDHHYFEFHVNPLNAFNDLFIIRPATDSPLNKRLRYGLMFIGEWNLKEVETAVQVHGEVNNPEVEDEGWTVEMRIPFSSLMLPIGQTKPSPGDVWRIQLVIQDGGFKHRYINWSPTYESWFHHSVATWGRVKFAE